MMTAEDVFQAKQAYLQIVGPLARDRTRRRELGIKHPLRDFLFEYYSFRPTELLRWSPGLGEVLVGVPRESLDWPKHYRETGDGLELDPTLFPTQRHDYVRWAKSYLEAVQSREPFFGCFGLHEWAMVYHDTTPRHAQIPLRLGHAGTDAVVEAMPLRCTHYDAYRFFTADAVPKNRIELTRVNAIDHDQPGCIHAIMDLYKFAYKIMPYCPSAVLAECFALALEARTLDMRASPYDFSPDLTPVSIETREGREEYIAEQRRLYVAGHHLRQKLLGIYVTLLDKISRSV
ncbi:MAG: 3-methyladenine DNA glycosylase [Fimbriiglobus sp.]